MLSRAHPDDDFPADPYPGAVPPFSFVHLDDARIGGRSHPLTFDVCWRVAGAGGAELDLWLAGHGAPPLAARVPVLSYGSNRNPSKITWLRRSLGLTGPVVVLRARTDGLAAVWASGFRARDGQRTSVLGAAPGTAEDHTVWLATPEQVAVLDRCEGRDDRYRLARLGTGAVHTDDGLRIERAMVLPRAVGHPPPAPGGREPGALRRSRPGRGVRARRRPGPGRRAAAATVRGAPDPDEWPAAVFVYGTLQPGHRAWPLLAGARGRTTPARHRGRAGVRHRLGYAALLPDGSARAPGWIVTVRDPLLALHDLDRYEGQEYRRIRVAATSDSGREPPAGRTPGRRTRSRCTRCPKGWTR